MGVKYASREQLLASPDVSAAAYASVRADSVLESASRDVEKLLHIKWIYPMTTTRSFDWPGDDDARYGRVWLGQTPLLSLTSASSGGVAIPAGQFKLYPDYGPPYRRIELSLASTYGLSAGATPQQSLALTGVFGLSADETASGTLTGAITSSQTTLQLDGSSPGVGRLLRIDGERMLITDRSFVTSSQTATLAGQMNAQALAVSDGTKFARGESIILDAERMTVNEIAGNTLIVQRATAGTTLAAHTGVAIFYQRQCTVQRGYAGTTAAVHASAAQSYVWDPPGAVQELTLAYGLDRFFQRGAGWARTIGSGDAERGATGRTIKDLEDNVRAMYGRIRKGAV